MDTLKKMENINNRDLAMARLMIVWGVSTLIVIVGAWMYFILS